MVISPAKIAEVREYLEPLIGAQLRLLRLPKTMLRAFEPSQVGTIVGTLMDACIPELTTLLPDEKDVNSVGLKKAPGILLDREGYPDYLHEPTDTRLELKLLYVDPAGDLMKKTQTRREPSARLTQKVTEKNVIPDRDILLVLSYQLRPLADDQELFAPTIVDIGLFPMLECIKARDHRLVHCGGKWFGNFETPAILSRVGKANLAKGIKLRADVYGRKESEGYDYNEDTNFGKLKRVPYQPLQEFLKANGAVYVTSGSYPAPWRIANGDDGAEDEECD